jgi:hypothetical protein
MAMVHMNQRRQHIRSTSKTPITSDIEDFTTNNTNSGTKSRLVYAVLVNQGQLYTDLTGKKSVSSSKGNSYVIVCCCNGTNKGDSKNTNRHKSIVRLFGDSPRRHHKVPFFRHDITCPQRCLVPFSLKRTQPSRRPVFLRRQIPTTIYSECIHPYVKLLPLPQPPVRARTDARTNPSAQRATQLRSVLARVYAVSIQNQITTTVT